MQKHVLANLATDDAVKGFALNNLQTFRSSKGLRQLIMLVQLCSNVQSDMGVHNLVTGVLNVLFLCHPVVVSGCRERETQ